MSENEKPQPNGQRQTNALNGNAKDGDEDKQNRYRGRLIAAKDKLNEKQQKIQDKKNPPGGYDATPIPSAPDGYTIKFTFHRAENLPMSDLNTRSSDPYVHATLTSSLAKRHKEDPNLTLRTPTVHINTNPEWNYEWTVAGIPSTGFRLKCRLYDEDPSDHDDRLGNVTIKVGRIGPDWKGIRNESFDIRKKMGSKRAYMIRGCAAMLSSNVHMDGRLWLSATLVGESENPHGRMYTVGTTSWTKHYSPMIGRIAGTKAPGSEKNVKDSNGAKTEKYERVAASYSEIKLTNDKQLPSESIPAPRTGSR